MEICERNDINIYQNNHIVSFALISLAAVQFGGLCASTVQILQVSGECNWAFVAGCYKEDDCTHANLFNLFLSSFDCKRVWCFIKK